MHILNKFINAEISFLRSVGSALIEMFETSKTLSVLFF